MGVAHQHHHHYRRLTLHHDLIEKQRMHGGSAPYSRSLVIGNEREGLEACRGLEGVGVVRIRTRTDTA